MGLMNRKELYERLLDDPRITQSVVDDGWRLMMSELAPARPRTCSWQAALLLVIWVIPCTIGWIAMRPVRWVADWLLLVLGDDRRP